ncbi:hypothetical protein ACIF9R_21395 [Streptomyces sp. NPDC086080]|uniref:hypothetical protein n=1 Tax=Streptomyces sp. NPDC086080 TaxID=3365748 RepID=UPI0037D1054B
MKGSRTAALLSGLTAAAAVALTACGVPPSGVIEAGAPASGMYSPSAAPPSSPATVSLFFLRDGDLTPYPRQIDDAGDLEAVVHLLFKGPAATETATAITELPRLTDAPRVVVADGILFVQLPGKTAPLSRRAMLQLTCTLDHAEADGGTVRRSDMSVSLHVLGDGWTMTQSDYACPVVSPSQEQPEAPTPGEPSG